MRVRYYIPTRGRIEGQHTVRNLPTAVLPLVTIVCPSSEVERLGEFAYELRGQFVRVVPQPDDSWAIGRKREWIYKALAREDVCDFAWQLDDDLRFRVCVDGKFASPRTDYQAKDLLEKFFVETIPALAAIYPVLGIGTSFMAPKGGVRENYHLGFAFGFGRDARDALEMNRMDVFEDIDYTLQMLRGGYRIGVSYDVTVDQVKPDAPGGVTGERTLETIRRDFERLRALHPGIVEEKPRRPGAHPAAITRVSWARAAKEGGLR